MLYEMCLFDVLGRRGGYWDSCWDMSFSLIRQGHPGPTHHAAREHDAQGRQLRSHPIQGIRQNRQALCVSPLQGALWCCSNSMSFLTGSIVRSRRRALRKFTACIAMAFGSRNA